MHKGSEPSVKHSTSQTSLKPSLLVGYRSSQKKSSAVATPASRSGVARPKSSVTDSSQKDTQVASNPVSGKLPQPSSKMSPKVSLGSIEQFRGQVKRKPQSSASKEKLTRKKEQRRNELKKEHQVKEQIKKSLANVINIYYPEQQQKHSPLDVSLTGPSEPHSIDKAVTGLGRIDFHFIEVVGRGGYGKVWKVEHRRSKHLYAMKEMSKALILMKKSVEGVQNERRLLTRLSHQFIANMVAAFHDRDNLYLLMDLLPGGDLRYHIGKLKRFNEEQTRFSIACIVLALEYLNDKKVLHRDIKPENLILDAEGYVHLTDFGIARSEKDVSDKDTSGTPGYMAPEVMCKQAHSYPVDYFALGVIGYEFMLGKVHSMATQRPYLGNSRSEIRQAILSKQVQIKKAEIPPGWSLEAADFINRLLQRQPRSRLGFKGGIAELKEHPWLKRYAWKKLLSKELQSPLTPEFHNYEPSSDQEDEFCSDGVNQYRLLERATIQRDLFADYFYKMSD